METSPCPKHPEEQRTRKAKADGTLLPWRCKPCERERSQRYRERHPEVREASRERAREQQRRYREENPEAAREAARERRRRWREANREADRAYSRRRYEENGDVIRERARLWREEHPEATREHARRWREANPEVSRRWREENPEVVTTSPHTTRLRRLDETTAARKPVLRWKPTPNGTGKDPNALTPDTAAKEW